MIVERDGSSTYVEIVLERDRRLNRADRRAVRRPGERRAATPLTLVPPPAQDGDDQLDATGGNK